MKRKEQKQTIQLPEWERLISAQAVFQAHFPESVLIGGTAVALHVKHRISIDADYVLADLKKHFENILKKVEEEAGWHTKRIQPPVLILGHFQGVRTGIRQLIRSEPLETTLIRGLKIPTQEEMLRIKAYLIVKRNTTRDFIDFVALFDHLGVTKALHALDFLDRFYPQSDPSISMAQQLCLQLAEPKPWDLSQMDLGHYKALQKPYSDWKEVLHRSQTAANKILKRRLGE